MTNSVIHCPWTLTRLVPQPLPWGTCSTDRAPSCWRTFAQCPTWTSPDAASFLFLMSCLWSQERDQHLLSIASHKEGVHCPQSWLVQAGQAESPQPLLLSLALKAFCHLSHSPLDTPWQSDIFLTLRYPKLPIVLEVGPHGCHVEQNSHPPYLASYDVLLAPQDTVGSLAARAHCWLTFSLPSTQTPESLSAGLPSSLSSPNLYV